jgi:hypothetical protein
VQPKSTYIDTIELYNSINEIKSIIPYNEDYINNIKIEGNFITNIEKQYNGYLIKNNIGNIIFEFDDFEILLNYGRYLSHINIKREFYTKELFNDINKDFISIILFEDANSLDILVSIEKKDILIKDIKISEYKENIFNLLKYILDFFTSQDKSYIDILQGCVKLNKEKLEKILKLNINWDKDKNRYCENKNRVYKKGILEKDDNGNFRLIIN